jgi:hypothetical protein
MNSSIPNRSRRSIEVPGVSHGNAPIPMGARVGNMIYSSGIMGKDPANDTLPADAAAQAKFMFMNLQSLLAQGGADLGMGKWFIQIKDIPKENVYRVFNIFIGLIVINFGKEGLEVLVMFSSFIEYDVLRIKTIYRFIPTPIKVFGFILIGH